MWRRQRRRALDGLDDEIRDHLDRETEINIARGMSPGKEFGKVLETAFEAQLEGAFSDLEGAQKWLEAENL